MDLDSFPSLKATGGQNRVGTPSKPHYQRTVIIWPIQCVPGRHLQCCLDLTWLRACPDLGKLFPKGHLYNIFRANCLKVTFEKLWYIARNPESHEHTAYMGLCTCPKERWEGSEFSPEVLGKQDLKVTAELSVAWLSVKAMPQHTKHTHTNKPHSAKTGRLIGSQHLQKSLSNH